MSSEDETRTQCVYFISAPSGYWKIGVAIDPWDRLKTLQIGHHEKLTLINASDCEADGIAAVDYERTLHEFLAPLRVQGEWFKFDKRAFEIAERLAFAKCCYPEMWARWWRADNTMVVA
jgi:hypothetical protein